MSENNEENINLQNFHQQLPLSNSYSSSSSSSSSSIHIDDNNVNQINQSVENITIERDITESQNQNDKNSQTKTPKRRQVIYEVESESEIEDEQLQQEKELKQSKESDKFLNNNRNLCIHQNTSSSSENSSSSSINLNLNGTDISPKKMNLNYCERLDDSINQLHQKYEVGMEIKKAFSQASELLAKKSSPQSPLNSTRNRCESSPSSSLRRAGINNIQLESSFINVVTEDVYTLENPSLNNISVQNFFIDVMRKKNKNPKEKGLIKKVLEQVGLFQKQKDIIFKNQSTNDTLFSNLSLESFEKNEAIFHLGEFGHKYYIIIHGGVHLLLPSIGSSDSPAENDSIYVKYLKSLKYKFTNKDEVEVDSIEKRKKMNQKKQKLKKSKFFLRIQQKNQSTLRAFDELNFNEKKLILLFGGIDQQRQDLIKTSFLEGKEYVSAFYPTMQLFKTFVPGDAFGEIALLTKQRRTATVLCSTKTYCLSLSKVGFDQIIGVYQKALIQQQLNFLIQFSFFEKIPKSKILSILHDMKQITCQKNQIIYKEGDLCENCYFVKEGDFEISKIESIDTNLDNLQVQSDISSKRQSQREQDALISLNFSHKIKKEKEMKKRIPLIILSSNKFFGQNEIVRNLSLRQTRATCISLEGKLFSISKNILLHHLSNWNGLEDLKQIDKVINSWSYERINSIIEIKKQDAQGNLNFQSKPNKKKNTLTESFLSSNIKRRNTEQNYIKISQPHFSVQLNQSPFSNESKRPSYLPQLQQSNLRKSLEKIKSENSEEERNGKNNKSYQSCPSQLQDGFENSKIGEKQQQEGKVNQIYQNQKILSLNIQYSSLENDQQDNNQFIQTPSLTKFSSNSSPKYFSKFRPDNFLPSVLELSKINNNSQSISIINSASNSSNEESQILNDDVKYQESKSSKIQNKLKNFLKDFPFSGRSKESSIPYPLAGKKVYSQKYEKQQQFFFHNQILDNQNNKIIFPSSAKNHGSRNNDEFMNRYEESQKNTLFKINLFFPKTNENVQQDKHLSVQVQSLSSSTSPYINSPLIGRRQEQALFSNQDGIYSPLAPKKIKKVLEKSEMEENSSLDPSKISQFLDILPKSPNAKFDQIRETIACKDMYLKILKKCQQRNSKSTQNHIESKEFFEIKKDKHLILKMKTNPILANNKLISALNSNQLLTLIQTHKQTKKSQKNKILLSNQDYITSCNQQISNKLSLKQLINFSKKIKSERAQSERNSTSCYERTTIEQSNNSDSSSQNKEILPDIQKNQDELIEQTALSSRGKEEKILLIQEEGIQSTRKQKNKKEENYYFQDKFESRCNLLQRLKQKEQKLSNKASDKDQSRLKKINNPLFLNNYYGPQGKIQNSVYSVIIEKILNKSN